MNISKKQFTDIVKAILKQERRDGEIADALDSVAKDGVNRSLVFSTPLISDIVKAIDVDEIVSWWLWDGPEHGHRADEFAIIVRDERIAIHNAEELYDYIEREYK